MLKLIKIDYILYQVSKVFLLFSLYKTAEYLIKISIQISKKNNNYIKILALIYAQSRNDKNFIYTLENFLKTHQLSEKEKEEVCINLGDAYAASNNYNKIEKIKIIVNLKKIVKSELINCYCDYLILFIKKNNFLNININFFKKEIRNSIFKNIRNQINFFRRFKILISNNTAPQFALWFYLLHLLKKKKKLFKNKKILADLKRDKDTNFVILVSCSYSFFKIFGIFFIKHIRNLNCNNIIHFHIVDSLNIKKKIFSTILQNKFTNINFTYGEKKNISMGDTSSARYLICKDIMNYYKKNVLISDIDTNFYLSPDDIIKRIKLSNYDMGFFFIKKNFLPWEKFAAGLSFFKYKNLNSYMFLNDMISYINIAKNNKNQVLWGAETISLYYAYYKNYKKNLRIFDFSKILNLDNLIIKLPKILQFKKRISKTLNYKFDSILNIIKFFLYKII